MQAEDAIIHLTGHITKDGRLDVVLPDTLPRDVDVELTLRLVKADNRQEEEYEDVPLHFEGKSSRDIMASGLFGAWADLGIEDSAAWVEDVRRRAERREL